MGNEAQSGADIQVSVQEAKKRLIDDRDFVYSKKFKYSLKNILRKYPDGVPLKIISQVLLMSEDELSDLEETIVLKIRQKLNVKLD